MTQEERIKYKDNIERINNMTLGMIYKMSTYNLCRLTDDFADPLVRMIFAKTVNIDEQRKLVKFLESAFIECGFFINDNETYFDDLSYEIDCNRIITEDGTARPPVMVTVPPSSTKEASTNIETPPFETTKKELEDENKRLSEKNKELEEENEQLKEENASTKKDESLKSELNRLKAIHEDTLVALLKPAFYNSDADARDFIRRINGLDNQGVTDVARQFLQDRKITPSKKGRFIWNILTAAKLYDCVEQNWTTALRK